MWSLIQLAGHACAYVKELSNFQNKNSHNSQISKKKKKEKKIVNKEILLPIISLKIIQHNTVVSLAYTLYVLSSIRLA